MLNTFWPCDRNELIFMLFNGCTSVNSDLVRSKSFGNILEKNFTPM